MRLLVLTHSFPPHEDPRAFRWGAIVRYWRENGIEIDVISANRRTSIGHPDSPHLLDFEGAGLPFRDWLVGRSPSDPQAAESSSRSRFSNGIRDLARSAAGSLNHHVWKKVHWPDYACLWIAPAVRTGLRLLASRRYDAMISVSNPYSSHLAALRLHRAFPDLPWLADIGDPFAAMGDAPVNNQGLYARRNWAIESDVLNHATRISVTTSPTRDLYSDTFRQAAGKIVVVPPLLSGSFEDIDGLHFVKDQPDRKRLVFFGMLYRNLRNPVAILRAFQQVHADPDLADWDLHFFGRTNDCNAEFDEVRDLLQRRIFVHGQVPRNRALREMMRADMLLNLGNANAVQLPSKLVEYAAAGKPILNVVSDLQDASSSFLADYPGTSILQAHELADPIAGGLALSRSLRELSTVNAGTLDAFLEPYRTEQIAGSYMDVLLAANRDFRSAA